MRTSLQSAHRFPITRSLTRKFDPAVVFTHKPRTGGDVHTLEGRGRKSEAADRSRNTSLMHDTALLMSSFWYSDSKNALTLVFFMGRIDPDCMCVSVCVRSDASPGRSGLGWPKDCHYPILLGQHLRVKKIYNCLNLEMTWTTYHYVPSITSASELTWAAMFGMFPSHSKRLECIWLLLLVRHSSDISI